MKKEEVKINVVGRSASGKSCVIFEIYKVLKTAGFEVELDLKDNLNNIKYKNEVDFIKQMLKNEKQRIECIKQKSKIILKELRAVKPFYVINEEKEEE